MSSRTYQNLSRALEIIAFKGFGSPEALQTINTLVWDESIHNYEFNDSYEKVFLISLLNRGKMSDLILKTVKVSKFQIKYYYRTLNCNMKPFV